MNTKVKYSFCVVSLFYSFCIIVSLFISSLSFSQIVINGGAKIVINNGTVSNPAYVILNPPPLNPIITSNTSDGIIMESEYNCLQYNLGVSTTSIIVPYMTRLFEQIPVTLEPTTAGVGSGNIRFSTVIPVSRTTGYDNVSYMPSDVVNMGSLSASNNSSKTIDRFWIIDANSYTQKPAVTLGFTYLDAELATNGGNTITESNLQAQRFNNNINDWGGYADYTPKGVVDISLNTVSNVIVNSADFFRSWTLNDNSVPLPIGLLNFESVCLFNSVKLNWCTASELNNKSFTIEESNDGIHFKALAEIPGNGTSTSKKCYSYEVNNRKERELYFRLKQTDFNGDFSYSKIIYVECHLDNENNFVIYPNPTNLEPSISSNNSGIYNIINELGQVIKKIELNESNNYKATISDLRNGIYFVTQTGNNQSKVKKLIITK